MSRVTSSVTHFKPLVANGKLLLEKLNFRLIEENDSKAIFRNSKGVVVEIVYQRYDPPEVWIGTSNTSERAVLGYLMEKYFDSYGEILMKYSNEQHEFDYSSFDYYFEFLSKYLPEIEDDAHFAATINEWKRGLY